MTIAKPELEKLGSSFKVQEIINSSGLTTPY